MSLRRTGSNSPIVAKRFRHLVQTKRHEENHEQESDTEQAIPVAISAKEKTQQESHRSYLPRTRPSRPLPVRQDLKQFLRQPTHAPPTVSRPDCAERLTLSPVVARRRYRVEVSTGGQLQRALSRLEPTLALLVETSSVLILPRRGRGACGPRPVPVPAAGRSRS